MRRTIIASVIACLVGAATVGGVGFAAGAKKSSKSKSRQSSGQTQAAKPTGPPPTMGEMKAKMDAAQDARLGKIADSLKVEKSKLKDALDAVKSDRLAAAVKANELTQAQADAITACQAAPLTCDHTNLPAGPFGGMGHRGGPGGPGDDRDASFKAIASKLGGDVTAGDVEKAFEAERPARGPGGPFGPGGRGGHRGPHGPGGPPPGGQQGGGGSGQYPSGPMQGAGPGF